MLCLLTSLTVLDNTIKSPTSGTQLYFASMFYLVYGSCFQLANLKYDICRGFLSPNKILPLVLKYNASLSGFSILYLYGCFLISSSSLSHFYQFLLLQFSMKVKSLSRVRLCNPMDSSLPGFFVHGILQARILEWVTISFSRGSS